MNRPLVAAFRSAIVIVFLVTGLIAGMAGALAQSAPPTDKIDRLLELLSDPDVKAWLAAQGEKAAPPPAEAGDGESAMAPAGLSSRLDAIRAHVKEITAAVPKLPEQFSRAWTILQLEFEDEGLLGIVALILGLVAVGLGITWTAFRLTSGYRDWMGAMPKGTPQGRVKNLGARLVYASVLTIVFIFGTAGVFLAFNWPPLLREIVLGYLSVAIITGAATMVTRVFLLPPSLRVPRSREIRVFPMTDDRAGHWHRWIGINVFWLMFVVVTFQLMGTFGFDKTSRLAMSIPTSFIQLVLILLAVWLRPQDPDAQADAPQRGAIGPRGWSWLLSLYFVVVWFLQVAGAWMLYWLLIAALVVPAAIIAAHKGVSYVLRAPDPGTDAKPVAPVMMAVIDRGIRMMLIIAGAALLARAWGIDVTGMSAGDTFTDRLMRGGINAAVIILAADFGWSIIKAVIAMRLGEMEGPAAAAHGQQDPRQARVRTLLPIFQNMLFAAIVIIGLLMVLSSLGVEIGPLIAGAGVVGVAIGFGAQTLVKDVIAGIFYLLDDAFRVGEYIQSGTYKGTVESFSLRSVKLRHHRGYLFTVPFGELGAVQNMSRDWVIEKFSINVDYQTDIDKARKIIKKIGQQFAEDPEFAPHIIEPLKLQGVQNFGDFGIELRLKLMTKPGEQFVIKRKAYIAIKKAFEDNGIKIPYPTVMVREGESAAAAAAHLQSRMETQAAAAQTAAAS